MPEKVVVGTRGSKLALAQTEKVVERLREAGYEVEVRIIRTGGDVMKDKPLHEFKGVGAFVQSIDEALAEGKVDIAVHSYKDVPSKIKGVIAAVLERESPCDCAILRSGVLSSDVFSSESAGALEARTLKELNEIGGVVGTSSLRRIAQIERIYPNLRVRNLRGNVDTRLRKLKEGEYDAILLAEAGLIRLGIDVERETLDPTRFVPSATQGIIAVETRRGEEELVSFMNHERTFCEASVERAVLETLGIGCAVPAGIYACVDGNVVNLIFHVYGRDRDVRVEERLKRGSAVEEAREIARNAKEECEEIIRQYRV